MCIQYSNITYPPRPHFSLFTESRLPAPQDSSPRFVSNRTVRTNFFVHLTSQVIAARNRRLKRATLRPLPEDHHLRGGSCLGRVSVTDPVAVPAAAALDSPAAIGRKLLSRYVPYADFDELPDPTRFQLHHDLKGWQESPSRLDFLYKELVRQRNAAVSGVDHVDDEKQPRTYFVCMYMRFASGMWR